MSLNQIFREFFRTCSPYKLNIQKQGAIFWGESPFFFTDFALMRYNSIEE